MRRLFWLSPVILAALAALFVVAGATADAPALAQENGGQAPASDLAISLSESAVSTFTGESFTFTSEITNRGSEATPPLIANLNFVATDHSTYIDPEDWSSQRTLNLDPIAAGASATQTWTVKPVLAGDVAVYVVVLPEPPALADAGALAASPAISVQVEEHRSLNPGGTLPVVLAVPAVLALAFAGVGIARGRIMRRALG